MFLNRIIVSYYELTEGGEGLGTENPIFIILYNNSS